MSALFEIVVGLGSGVVLGYGMIGAVHVLDWLFGDRIEPVDVKD